MVHYQSHEIDKASKKTSLTSKSIPRNKIITDPNFAFSKQEKDQRKKYPF
jgi:hypothetical protein